MRLQAKSEINKLKAQEKQREIDEGLKIANRVDNLREIQAQEEASLEKFRKETISRINEEIVSRTKEVADLCKEVSRLEESRLKALKPLTEELTAIEEGRANLDLQYRELEDRELKISKKEAQISQNLKSSEEELNRIKEEKKRSEESLQYAERHETEAKNHLEESRQIKTDTLKLRQETEKSLNDREVSVTNRERELIEREERNEVERESLRKDRIFVNDQRATLAGMIKKSQKNNGASEKR